MLRLIRPWASKLTPRASRQGPHLPDRDPIPNLPIALTQCHFTWCLGNIWFLAKRKKKEKGKKSQVSLSEERNLNHYDHFNAHTNGSNSLDMFGDRRVRIWFGLQPCWGFIPWPLQSASLLCGERLRGGQVKPVSPIWCHHRFASRTGGRAGGEGLGKGGGRGKSFPSCRSSPQSHNYCLLFMQDPIKPGCRSRSALAAIWQPQLPRHLLWTSVILIRCIILSHPCFGTNIIYNKV